MSRPANAAFEPGLSKMNLRAVALTDDIPGRLWLTAMPGRFTAWAGFILDAQQANLSLVVCLNPLDEVASLSPAYHHAIVEGALPFRGVTLPMRNFGLPADRVAFRDGIVQAGDALARGDSVLLHCAAGIGRTGTAAACLLKHLGLSVDEALSRVRMAGSNPENAVQSGLVDGF